MERLLLQIWVWTLLLTVGKLAAQQPAYPHTLTPSERQMFPAFQQIEDESALIAPATPSTSVRTMAEWEEVQAIVLSWTSYTDVLTELVRYAIDECEVFILTHDPLETQTALGNLALSERIHLLPIGFNSIWMRDYGPWSVYHNYVDSLAISDYLYNRPERTADDLVPHEIADHLALPLYNADDAPYRWIHAGGNFIRDGLGTAWSSDLVLKENTGKTGLELATYAKLFFGIDDYRILPRLPYDIIHHLDMHMRILDEETIAVNQYPPDIADGPQIEANLRWLQQHYRTPYGRPYKILRLPVPSQGGYYPPNSDYLTYSNAIFINRSLLVPIYGDSLDSVALQIYREHLPGYRIVGINCNSVIEAIGALHCIAKVIGTPNPLYIAHPRLRNTYARDTPFPVTAQVYHHSGIERVTLYYRTDTTAAYQSLPMIATGVNGWKATIPAQPVNTSVYYYIEARANDGKIQHRPLPAPAAYYEFQVESFSAAPIANWRQSLKYLAPDMSVRLFADIAEGANRYRWTLAGGTPNSANTAEVNVSYSEEGIYPVQLNATNPLGTSRTQVPTAIQVLPTRRTFIDDFTAYPNPRYWAIDNSQAPTSGWQWVAGNYCYGGHWQIKHQEAATQLERAYLRTALDLRRLPSATFNFKVAYAAHPEGYAHMDELRVYLTTATGEVLNVYNKGGAVLSNQLSQETPFEPTSCTEWRQETIDLRPWLGQQVVLTFESVGGQGNTLFLDDVQLTTNVLPEILIIEPTPEATLSATTDQPKALTIELIAYDFDGEVDFIEVYRDETPIDTIYIPPYILTDTLPRFGRYCIQARAYDAEGAANWSTSHCINYDQVVRTQKPTYLSYGQVFPNPVQDKLHFRWTHSEVLKNIKANLLDAQGRIVQVADLDLRTGQDLTLDIHTLNPGTYQLRLVRRNELIWTGQVVKIDNP